jgi:hypothetical protein
VQCPPAPAARAFLFLQKAPGSCAFAEWLGRGFGNCGSYDDYGARGRAGVAGGVGGDVVDGVGLAVIEPQQKRWRLGDLALATRVAIRKPGFGDPCILGEPFVLYAAQRTECAAEMPRQLYLRYRKPVAPVDTSPGCHEQTSDHKCA